ncbi:MAG: hypothetical protein IPL46_19985 [Saprospiraceae bacterium]|nr:hypothetical protein [Saprospiraceae bacterium]
MASSSAEDSPRGMSFLYMPNRLNVAISRAQCTFILVGSPNVFAVDCRSPEQMVWANGYCRFLEKAKQFSEESLDWVRGGQSHC